MSIWVKNFQKSQVREKFSNNLDFAQIFNNLLFCQNFEEKYIVFFFIKIHEKSWFQPRYSKISTFVKILEIISFFVIIFDNLLFNQSFGKKSRFSPIFSKNLDFGQNFWILDFIQNFGKIWILVQCFVNLDFCQNFWISPFWSKFTKISTLV